MTCIVGIRTTHGAVLAGDSMCSTSYTKFNHTRPKVFNLSPRVAAGSCGSPRVNDILAHHVDVDDAAVTGDEFAWSVHEFIPAIREVFSEHGFRRVKEEVETIPSSLFLLAVRGRVFTVQSDFSVTESDLCYDATGSGQEVAFGALWSTVGHGPHHVAKATAVRRATDAINAAAFHTPHVGGPVSIAYTIGRQ